MPTLWCENGPSCSYGVVTETDEGVPVFHPEKAYSQQGSPIYLGLCLNCLDDHKRDAEFGDYD